MRGKLKRGNMNNSDGIKKNKIIKQAKIDAAAQYGDILPLQLLARVRIMAENRGWVRRRIETKILREDISPIGEPVFVPLPGQEVGSGARPSARDPKKLGLMLDRTLFERGWNDPVSYTHLTLPTICSV